MNKLYAVLVVIMSLTGCGGPILPPDDNDDIVNPAIVQEIGDATIYRRNEALYVDYFGLVTNIDSDIKWVDIAQVNRGNAPHLQSNEVYAENVATGKSLYIPPTTTQGEGRLSIPIGGTGSFEWTGLKPLRLVTGRDVRTIIRWSKPNVDLKKPWCDDCQCSLFKSSPIGAACGDPGGWNYDFLEWATVPDITLAEIVSFSVGPEEARKACESSSWKDNEACSSYARFCDSSDSWEKEIASSCPALLDGQCTRDGWLDQKCKSLCMNIDNWNAENCEYRMSE